MCERCDEWVRAKRKKAAYDRVRARLAGAIERNATRLTIPVNELEWVFYA